MSDSLLHAIIGGNPLNLPGLGANDGGLTLLFPLSLGGTVNDLANALHLPVEAILAVNPGLRADSPLNVSQVVDLPDDHIDQIMRSVNLAGSQAFVTPPPDAASSSSVPSDHYVVDGSSDGVSRVMPTPRQIAAAFGSLDLAQQNTPLPSPVEKKPDHWVVGVSPDMSTPSPGKSSDASVNVVLAAPTLNLTVNPSRALVAPALVLPISAQPSAALSNQTTTSGQVATPATTAVPAMPASNMEPVKSAAAASSLYGSEGVFGFGRAANVGLPAGQDRQRNPGAGIAPPPPMDDSRFAGPLARVQPANGGIAFVAPATAMNAMDLHADGHPMMLQLMALWLAQSGGSNAGTAASSPLVDPQALAALAASQRDTKVIDLGAGRSMAFSLVHDRLQRIDPIGQEQRAASRRSGEGLQELRISSTYGEQTEQTDEQREQGRRRRAAIAAMRRRRRPRSRRCRYWRGDRRDLRTARAATYPKQVDFAEFRRRQPPRYMWSVGA
ncbi:hypothetical protein [Dyella choica]|uniref:Uncharacterized protein n=1 Tax=Dyella choica TaxID=1927959 RepID=A0A3S0PPZ3_9GAMM|nr:hypothetical protein [Dyella choica]RUL79050.1 hypothetical protein EKH80_04430 [Dyella choica]